MPIPLSIFPNTAIGDVARVIRGGYTRLPVDRYRHKTSGVAGDAEGTGRQRTFWRVLEALADHLGTDQIPIDFELQDGRRVYLDRGCVKMAETAGWIHGLRIGSAGVVDTIALRRASTPASSLPPGGAGENQFLSLKLEIGAIYTRKDLVPIVGVKSFEALSTGVFVPREGMRSTLLFVTEQKKSGRTAYEDRLEGDLLYWQGQEQRRTDHWVSEARERGVEILVFHRHHYNDFADAGFRYLGPFECVSHQPPASGIGPSDFVLRRIGAVAAPDESLVALAADEADADGDAFDPESARDARERVQRQIKERRGQKTFRDKLLSLYRDRCAITGCPVPDVLEAAHITPFLGPDTHHITNGLLLRADLHTLFDCALISIDPGTLTVSVAPKIRESSYGKLDGKPLRKTNPGPSPLALAQHFAIFQRKISPVS